MACISGLWTTPPETPESEDEPSYHSPVASSQNPDSSLGSDYEVDQNLSCGQEEFVAPLSPEGVRRKYPGLVYKPTPVSKKRKDRLETRIHSLMPAARKRL
jgi:hypothetical protein